jgi:hypothetical protein
MDSAQGVVAPGGAVRFFLKTVTSPPDKERGVHGSWCMGSTQGHVHFSQCCLALQSRQREFRKEYVPGLSPVQELWQPFLGWQGAQLLLECLALDRVKTE